MHSIAWLKFANPKKKVAWQEPNLKKTEFGLYGQARLEVIYIESGMEHDLRGEIWRLERIISSRNGRKPSASSTWVGICKSLPLLKKDLARTTNREVCISILGK